MNNKKTILIVEDETTIQSVLHDKLENEGFNILLAKDGEEGLTVALKEHPDLILLDIVMPKVDGVSMLQKIREDAWGKGVQVIVLTNITSNEKVAEMIENDAFEYLVKSDIKIEEIVTKIIEKLKN